MGGIYFDKQMQKLLFLVLSCCKFYCSNYAFLPHDYTCSLRRVGRYDGAFGF